MDIRGGLDGLRSLLGVPQTATPSARPVRNGATAGTAGAASDHATLSQAASEAAQTSAGDGVRSEKVAAIQAALASGTYSVPVMAVASRMVDAMLAGGR